MTRDGIRRVVVRGTSGSGKSTLAAELADRLGVVHVELDALNHLPGWQVRPVGEFRRLVDRATRAGGWVVDGNYDDVVGIAQSRADLVVWLDLSRWRTIARVTRRTVWRGLTRQELWNGNRERLASLFRPDPDTNVVLWAWQSWPRRHRAASEAPHDPALAHARVVVLTSPGEVTSFLHTIE